MHRQPEDVLLRKLCPSELAADPAGAHHVRAVADVDDLGELGADQQDGGAAFDQVLDQREDFALGADVDAARRLVEQKEAATRGQPFADDDLLLVATGKHAGQAPGRGRGYAQPVDQSPAPAGAPVPRDTSRAERASTGLRSAGCPEPSA